MPFALAVSEKSTMPVKSLEIKHPLAHLTVAALRHSHHPVDSFHRTAGPYRLPQKRLDLRIGSRPLSTQPVTKHLRHHCQGLSPHPLLPFGLPHSLAQGPERRQRLSQSRLRYSQCSLIIETIQMTQRPSITQQPLGLAPALLLKRCHRLVELRLSRLSALESPPGITPRQR
jgi:hypothetical protein